ncbi:hypothetical protein CRU98_06515 [Arcobacter sp. CECT 8986]|uniref:hypothetical protein n=1 Tax=Arcobacter sp. CECT 8986 TaxID=2044507 RepID=UPI001009ACFC|nr:hypothetical protein [Arcobacter sp. CECT 8986]RXJ99675.1 hypothetical protein CRU98_06515 [Arcobacter sp. CECT 8986]
MFIGYLRNNFEDNISTLLESDELFELQLLKNTYNSYPQYCFAAYEKEEIIGVLCAYSFDNYIYINMLKTIDLNKDITRRLVSLLIKNIEDENIYLLIEDSISKELEQLGFKKQCKFIRFVHTSEPVAFNFSNSIAKQISEQNYDEIATNLDKIIFEQNRQKYILKECMFESSLKLCTKESFMNSYAVNKKYIRISPWMIKKQSFLDAEKLLRGVLYYRGLKKIFAYAYGEDEDILQLYENYKFKKDKDFSFMYLKEEPNIKFENLYAI